MFEAFWTLVGVVVFLAVLFYFTVGSAIRGCEDMGPGYHYEYADGGCIDPDGRVVDDA